MAHREKRASLAAALAGRRPEIVVDRAGRRVFVRSGLLGRSTSLALGDVVRARVDGRRVLLDRHDGPPVVLPFLTTTDDASAKHLFEARINAALRETD